MTNRFNKHDFIENQTKLQRPFLGKNVSEFDIYTEWRIKNSTFEIFTSSLF
jgi:hypothetical protein